MPRIARAIAPGFPHHVVQRGNNRENIFLSDEDRAVYLFLLKRYSDKWNAPVSCYCLMADHVHLLARPSREESLQKMMQGVTLCYAQHMNRKYRRTGSIWQSRYQTCVVDQAAYLWAVARYIEQNPVRAAIVESPQDYVYSSARAHFGLVQDAVLGEDLFPEIQRNEYVEFIQSGVPAGQTEEIRQSTRTGRPFGTGKFVAEIERRLEKRLVALPIGRPRKKQLLHTGD
jgi:putative transposase